MYVVFHIPWHSIIRKIASKSEWNRTLKYFLQNAEMRAKEDFNVFEQSKGLIKLRKIFIAYILYILREATNGLIWGHVVK